MGYLEKLYSDLDFQSGELFPAADTPEMMDKNVWLEKGEWLSAAKRAGAEKMFFINNNPIVVFAKCGEDHVEKLKTFNRIWNLARPRLLFLSSPGEITVYDLAQKPIDLSKGSKKRNKLITLATLHDIGKVAQELQDFHRDNIESGKIFEQGRFGDLKYRADKSLIRDLKIVRRELIDAGLSGEKIKYAHALIGRSIFIRYLEDRKILTEDYFRKVAKQSNGWTNILNDDSIYTSLDFSTKKILYPRILSNHNFTYALFESLARDFNGDMFPDVAEEKKVVTGVHLNLIHNLLYADTGIQRKLFFYCYQFDIVPLDLISSIYEEFYHPSINDEEKKIKARLDGAFYTPPVLVEFILSRVLTAEDLKKTPRILDPACGSGIFLVEAFRRLVRYKRYFKKSPLSFDELKEILHKQIAGIEVNDEAAKVAAFSLYLSMLHYLEPPSINEQIKQGNKLPRLIATKANFQDHYQCIWIGNSFDVESINGNSLWQKRFGEKCADIVVGNPPWGALGSKADAITKKRERVMLDWCQENDKPIGDKEPSQAFLWRALDFLKDGGKAGMLVSAGILFKHNPTTQAFRNEWMDKVCLNEVFNFSHVRRFFFKGAISPFIAIYFIKGDQDDHSVTYWSAKQKQLINNAQAVSFSLFDRQILHDLDLTNKETWKVTWWGRISDVFFIKKLRQFQIIQSIVDRQKTGQGFKQSPPKYPAPELEGFRTLDLDTFSRYDKMKFNNSIPYLVYRKGNIDSYKGRRLLIKRGISETSIPKGWIISRYEEMEPFCYTSAIIGVKLNTEDDFNYKIILGILWSSFSRYLFFNTSSTWGLWHDEIDLDNELLQLPIVLDKNRQATHRIITIVDNLRNYHPQKQDTLHPDGVPKEQIEETRRKWEAELDEAVFELYGLNEEQKDLIRDCCEVTLPFFYKPFNSIGAMPAVCNNDMSWIEIYVKIFARRWNAYLGQEEEMCAEVHVGAHGNMLAIEFFPADKKDEWNLERKNDSWGYILEQIGKSLPQPMGNSQIVMDGVVHVVSNNSIIIIKRNEKRFWTRSMAREDADATLCRAMQIERRNS